MNFPLPVTRRAILLSFLSVSLTHQELLARSAQQTQQWEVDAGGSLKFDVVSVKQNIRGSLAESDSNIPLGVQDMFSPTGGLLFATNQPLLTYMTFAYKLTPEQIQAVRSQLPKWAASNRYDIQARVAANPTKDQYRLAMQALLADRFKLAVRFETKREPVLALMLDKPGKLGPHLQLHSAAQECSTAVPAPGTDPRTVVTVSGGFPGPCGYLVDIPSPTVPGLFYLGGRNVPLSMLASMISDQPWAGIDRPVIDGTRLGGKVDFYILDSPIVSGPLPPGVDFKPDPSLPTVREALKKDLGLKLESQTGSVTVMVIDHIQEPTPN